MPELALVNGRPEIDPGGGAVKLPRCAGVGHRPHSQGRNCGAGCFQNAGCGELLVRRHEQRIILNGFMAGRAEWGARMSIRRGRVRFMIWSLRLGQLLGIKVYLHFTFLLLLAFLGFYYWHATQSFAAALRGIAFIVALFGCVVLHELGHALMARRYGIRTRDITLLPIGGIARMERMPEKPMQELWVALAGPAVNLAIAGALLIVLAATGGMKPVREVGISGGSFLQHLMMVNLALVAFNILPAFPMDGGRILRAMLSLRLGRRRATSIAASVGQGMAIFFGLVGFLYNPFLIFIGIFVYLGAQAEAGMVEMQSALAGLCVRDAMITRFQTLGAHDTLTRAVRELLAGAQQDFPVLEHGQPIGVLRRNDLVRALSEGRSDAVVTEAMSRDCETADASAPLLGAFESMRGRDCSSMPVATAGRIVGLLTLENISEMIIVKTALDHRVADLLPAGNRSVRPS